MLAVPEVGGPDGPRAHNGGLVTSLVERLGMAHPPFRPDGG